MFPRFHAAVNRPGASYFCYYRHDCGSCREHGSYGRCAALGRASGVQDRAAPGFAPHRQAAKPNDVRAIAALSRKESGGGVYRWYQRGAPARKNGGLRVPNCREGSTLSC
jgi:hypothetical protein